MGVAGAFLGYTKRMNRTDVLPESLGIVYVLTNDAMPGLVKIGRTSRDTVDARLRELFSTGVPLPFECAYACRVKDDVYVERRFHRAFGPYRLNAQREFFPIEPEQAIALLELLAVEDVTPDVKASADHVDEEASASGKKITSRRPNLNFVEMGIPLGSTLRAVADPAVTVTVVADKIVELNGEQMSLTAATRLVKDMDYNIQPSPHWSYDGILLKDIYELTYGEGAL